MEECNVGLKVLRELCGAHGYWNQAGYDFLIDVKSASVTLEGDAYVMFQQTARDIFKNLAKVGDGRIAKRDFSYLNDISKIVNHKLDRPNLEDPLVLLEILKASALFQILRTSKCLSSREEIPYQTKWNKLYLADIVLCAKLHSVYHTALINYEEVQNSKLSSQSS